MPSWLLTITYTIGRRQSATRFSDSWNAPVLVVASPIKHITASAFGAFGAGAFL